MKIAIIGSGIAGNVAAYRLQHLDITLFEAERRIGGHTHTLDVQLGGRHYAIDTGFIVFNDRTYPNFVALLNELGVASQPSSMSFSVSCQRTGLEYNGTSLKTMFVQRRNLWRPSFYRMIRDILRFNREAPRLLTTNNLTQTLEDYLEEYSYSAEFIEHYLVPMGAAIWSSEPEKLLEFPAQFLIRFFHHHGMLSIDDRPQWRVVQGGSVAYVQKLVQGFRDRIRLNTPVTRVHRSLTHVEIETAGGARERFDRVIFACHSDQALALLADPTPTEREVLGAIPYQENDVVLHTDTRLLPTHRAAWAAWNYHVPLAPKARVAVTYNMNILQSIVAPATFCVTLNYTEAIAPEKIIARLRYRHPIFDVESVAAQARHAELNGRQHSWFCGAYWRNGFHEDGVASTLAMLKQFGEQLKRA